MTWNVNALQLQSNEEYTMTYFIIIQIKTTYLSSYLPDLPAVDNGSLVVTGRTQPLELAFGGHQSRWEWKWGLKPFLTELSCKASIHLNGVFVHDKKFILTVWKSGPCLNMKAIFPRYGDSHVKEKAVSWPLIFNIGISILVRRHLNIETPPGLNIPQCLKTWNK